MNIEKPEKNIKQAFDNAERIGVIGSPSSTGGLTIDILGTAVDKRLIGNLSIFRYMQDGKQHYALGQITEITMKNVWSEDPTMRGLIRQKGRVDPITERQDIHTANMMVSSVFSLNSGEIEPSIFGTVPCTGTQIKLLDENVLNSLLADYSDQLFYLGRAYGTDIKLPMWFKHFTTGSMGSGEAYHIGIFGKTGSGKSILALMMMFGYAIHKNMSIFVLDPQGQFSKEFYKPEIKKIIENQIKRKIKLINLHNLILTGERLFRKILIISGFLRRQFNIISEDNQDRAVN
ncbi:MAG: helicase HerA domain-containing protein, partial [Candidatus Helarchaeota archaeon]